MVEGLSRIQFDVMVTLDSEGIRLTGDGLSGKLGYPASEIERTLCELTDKGYLSPKGITTAGYSVLEPYRAKRAIFIAAGFGLRLAPITYNTPKPLVRVNGQRIIDGLIDAVLAAGISDIVIVRGYLAEQFDQLLYKYPMIRFLENPAYSETNNISSAFCARYLMRNAYVFEADLLMRNPSLIQKYQYTSNFLGFKKEISDDWCFTVDGRRITSHKIGGTNCYQEVGISYWDEFSGRKLTNHIQQAYEMPDGKDKFWTQVPLSIYPEEYYVEVRECRENDIVEIDTFDELKSIDRSYDL